MNLLLQLLLLKLIFIFNFLLLTRIVFYTEKAILKLFYSVYFLNFIVKSSLTTIDSAFTNVSQEFNFLYISD
jgi:hypothetical protein